MKSKVYKSSLAKCIVLALALVVLLLSVASRTQAKGPGSIPGNATIAVVLIGGHPGMNNNSPAAELKARVLHIVLRNARLNPKSVKVICKGCGCAAMALDGELFGFGSCMKGCLADAGASYIAVVMCGATCVFGAVPLCAICVGLSVTAVEVCALGCAAYPGPFRIAAEESYASNRTRQLKGKSRVRPIRT